MEKTYLISFGDSDKFRVSYAGGYDEFEKSAELQQIKNAVYDYVKNKLPEASFGGVLDLHVEEAEDKVAQYPYLDDEKIQRLKDDALRQVQVKYANKRLNSNDAFGS